MNPDFYRRVVTLQTRGQRLGQAVWNATSSFHPGLVKDLQGTRFDPFHNDAAVPEFLEILADRLARKS